MKSISGIFRRIFSGFFAFFFFASILYSARVQEASSEEIENSTAVETVDSPVYISPVYSINDLILEYEQAGNLTDTQRSQLPLLIDEYNIKQFDVSDKRVLLFLFSDTCNFLRMATWNEVNQEYRIRDTKQLPIESSLDTYHDGNCVLLWLSNFEIDSTYDALPFHELFLTFEYTNEDWYLMSFTDGSSFFADICNQVYCFNDYYDSSAKYCWYTGHVLLFEDFNVLELAKYISAYNEKMPNRFSVTE